MNVDGYESLKLSLISAVADGEGPMAAGGHSEDPHVMPASTEDLQDETDKNLYLFEVSQSVFLFFIAK